jgi:hypothetical protein
MTDHSPNDRTSGNARTVDRRHVLGVGAGVGVTLLAGCTGGTDSGTSGDDGTGDEGSTAGTFRLLISDQPVAIGDFDSLNVSFDRARIFRGEADDEDGEATNESETEETNETETNETDETNETQTNETETDDSETDEVDDESDDEEESESDDDGGFSVINLDGATVDLTEVVGDKAIGVFEGELEAGRYSKIELYASNVEGVVDGDSVDVKIPSDKLQIVKPFEISADEPVSFVFDINVVKKGNNDEYNLLPVISESGVAGKDVEVEEVGGDDGESEGDDAAGNETDTDDGSGADSTDGNETSTDTGGNETSADGQ